MTQWHLKSKKKSTGGTRTSKRRCDKKKSWKGGDAVHTKLTKDENEKRKQVKTLGNTTKVKLKEVSFVQAMIDGKSQKLSITDVIVNDADRHFARRLIITKGAIIEATQGKEKVLLNVTSRPGQSGLIQAKPLTQEEKDALTKRLEKKKKTKKEEKPGKKKKTETSNSKDKKTEKDEKNAEKPRKKEENK